LWFVTRDRLYKANCHGLATSGLVVCETSRAERGFVIRVQIKMEGRGGTSVSSNG